jgi:TRAP-type uncharacterized transport system fused permease subunit
VAIAVLILGLAVPVTASFIIAAAAITGGNGFKTMMLTCRYTLPAFLVPFAFILAPKGEGLLLQGGLETIAFAVVVSIVAVIALGLALEGWLRGEISIPARIVIGAAALLLLWLEPTVAAIGVGVLAAGLVLHALTRRKHEPAAA